MNVTGVWLRRIGDDAQVLVEIDGGWRLVIVELLDGSFSHIVEESGMANAPADPIAAAVGPALADQVRMMTAAIDVRRADLGDAMATRAAVIRDLIAAGETTREDVARACGVPSSTVYGWMHERNTTRVPQATHR